LLVYGEETSHAFLYSDGRMTDLGTTFPYSSVALDINDSGQVLGQFRVSLDPLVPSHAFFYDGTSVRDLNDLVSGLPAGWVLSEASFYSVTDQIIAIGQYGSRSSVFLLSVPEPTGAIGAAALASLLIRRGRRVIRPCPRARRRSSAATASAPGENPTSSR
jgi:hypothetical protein